MKGDNRFMHGAVVQQTTLKERGGARQVIGSTITRYDHSSGNASTLVIPREVAALETDVPLAASGPDALPPYVPAAGYDPTRYKSRLLYEKYDEQGNLVQYRQTNGSPVTYLWGYNASYPVAEIKNATYDQVKAALGVASPNYVDLGAGGLSAAQKNALRNVSGAQVATFDYTPLEGLRQVTDPNGVSVSYEYDGLQRLQTVRDRDNQPVSSYQYHYRQQ
jgi:YD repeat-containing protein